MTRLVPLAALLVCAACAIPEKPADTVAAAPKAQQTEPKINHLTGSRLGRVDTTGAEMLKTTKGNSYEISRTIGSEYDARSAIIMPQTR